ncbi:hypothetical protein [Streptomyces sp. NPDC003006]
MISSRSDTPPRRRPPCRAEHREDRHAKDHLNDVDWPTVSRTLREADWNITILREVAPEEILALKEQAASYSSATSSPSHRLTN